MNVIEAPFDRVNTLTRLCFGLIESTWNVFLNSQILVLVSCFKRFFIRIDYVLVTESLPEKKLNTRMQKHDTEWNENNNLLPFIVIM